MVNILSHFIKRKKSLNKDTHAKNLVLQTPPGGGLRNVGAVFKAITSNEPLQFNKPSGGLSNVKAVMIPQPPLQLTPRKPTMISTAISDAGQKFGAMLKTPIIGTRTSTTQPQIIRPQLSTPVYKQSGPMIKPTTINYGPRYTGVGSVQSNIKGLREGVFWDSGEYMSPAGKRYSWGTEKIPGTNKVQPMGGVKSLPFEAIPTKPIGYENYKPTKYTQLRK